MRALVNSVVVRAHRVKILSVRRTSSENLEGKLLTAFSPHRCRGTQRVHPESHPINGAPTPLIIDREEVIPCFVFGTQYPSHSILSFTMASLPKPGHQRNPSRAQHMTLKVKKIPQIVRIKLKGSCPAIFDGVTGLNYLTKAG
jgi:hypothetical protein